jgi:hypothetical protein
MLEATKQVKSFRELYVDGVAGTQHSGRLWEVDCNRGIIHKQTQTGDNLADVKEDLLLAGYDRFLRGNDGYWKKTGDTHVIYSGKWYCDNLAQGTLRDLLPDTRAMLRSAMIGPGDKKAVNGVQCRDYKFAMKSATSGEQGTICIGLKDHLPYEMALESGGRYSYTDYNRPIQIEAPEDALQAASAVASN